MSMSSIPSHSPSGKLYGWVERIGNKVPHPFLLFIYLIVILMVATAVLSAFDVSVRSPADGSLVAVKNLLSVDGLHWFLPNVIKTSAASPRWAPFWRWYWGRAGRARGFAACIDGENGIPRQRVTPAIWCCLSPSSAISPPTPRW
jgi:hypothetical protein